MSGERRVLGPSRAQSQSSGTGVSESSRSSGGSNKTEKSLGLSGRGSLDANTGRVIQEGIKPSGSRGSSSRSGSGSEKSAKKDKKQDKKKDSKKDSDEREKSPSSKRDRESQNKGGSRDKDKEKKAEEKVISVEGTIYAILPKLKDVQDEEKPRLISQKLEACTSVYDFRLPELSVTEKEGKRQTLVEIIDIFTGKGTFTWSESLVSDVFDMVGTNIFRPLVKRERTPMDILDPEDEEPVLEPMWPHLELVYDLATRVVNCKDLSSDVFCKFINTKFIMQLTELFDSDDPRERDYLKLLVNKIYGRFSTLRSTIRRAIQTACIKAVSEQDARNGFNELLEIMGRIIGGLSTPLKEESRELLVNILLPLHKVEWLGMFHPELSNCIKKFVDKDPKLTYDVMIALLRFWPFSLGSKQVLFISEVEELLGLMPLAEFKRLQDPLAHRLALCLSSPHSELAEKSLALWKSDRFVKLITQHCRDQFPRLISALYSNFTQHWHHPVHNRSLEVLKTLMAADPELFDTGSAKHRKMVEAQEREQEERERKWAVLQSAYDRRKSGGTALLPARSSRKKSTAGVKLIAQADVEQEGPMAKENSRKNLSNELQLTRERYGVAMTWERGDIDVDIGLQALAVDTRGRIIDAVHELCPTTMQAMIHRAEDRPAVDARSECGGMIWFALSRLPEQVALIVFVVCALAGGHLRDTLGRGMHIVEEATVNEFAHYVLDRPAGDAGVVAVIRRSAEKTWRLLRMEEFAKTGRHFMDILEPTVGKVIREVIPAVPKRQKPSLAFSAMATGSVACLPTSFSAKWLFVGLGWDLTPSEAQNVGLTLSAVFFDAQTRHLGVVNLECPEACGGRHSGPGMLGQGVVLDLQMAPEECVQIFIVGHPANSRSTYELLQKPSLCIVDPSGSELLRFAASADPKQGPCMVSGRFFRTDGCWSSASSDGSRGSEDSRWAFQALGVQCSGSIWQDSMVELRSICERPLATFQKLPADVHSGGSCTVCL